MSDSALDESERRVCTSAVTLEKIKSGDLTFTALGLCFDQYTRCRQSANPPPPHTLELSYIAYPNPNPNSMPRAPRSGSGSRTPGRSRSPVPSQPYPTTPASDRSHANDDRRFLTVPQNDYAQPLYPPTPSYAAPTAAPTYYQYPAANTSASINYQTGPQYVHPGAPMLQSHLSFGPGSYTLASLSSQNHSYYHPHMPDPNTYAHYPSYPSPHYYSQPTQTVNPGQYMMAQNSSFTNTMHGQAASAMGYSPGHQRFGEVLHDPSMIPPVLNHPLVPTHLESTQYGLSANQPTPHVFNPAQATSILANNNITAQRDINYTVVGNVTTSRDTPVLHTLKKLLKPINAAHDSYEADQRSKCFENTRVQLLADIEKWVTGGGDQAPIFILDGVAGIGKSTVAQTMAEQAVKLGVLGASFFFTRNEEDRTTAKYFFPTIAFQLARGLEPFAHQLLKALEQDPDAPQKTLSEQLSLLILNPFQALALGMGQQVLIIVDALDECKEHDGKLLLTLLAQHIRQLPWLKFFIASRPEYHIRRVLERDANHELFRLHEIENIIVHADIRLYLESSLSSEQVKIVFPHRDPPWHPTCSEMEILCGICGTLFIIASTAVKFILDSKRANPGQRLSLLLEGVSSPDYSGSKYTDVMDKVYIQIILSSAPSDLGHLGDDWIAKYQAIVGAIVTLHAPLSCSALASLLGLSEFDIIETLAHLHSLVAPSGPDMVFRVHHKSFPDFITSRDRIQAALGSNREHLIQHFQINVQACHSQLAKGCFHVMSRSLKANILQLPLKDWYRSRAEQPQLQLWKPTTDLVYAIQHWASHLQASEHLDEDLMQELFKWSTQHIMTWLEVLGILNLIDHPRVVLKTVLEVLDSDEAYSHWTGYSTVKDLLHDAAQCASQSRALLDFSPMHIHWSGLTFIPDTSQLHKFYKRSDTVQALSGLDQGWNPLVAILKGAGSLNFSPDGSRLVSASRDNTIWLWNGMNGDHLATLTGHSYNFWSIAFSPDGSRLASSASDDSIQLWDGMTGDHLATLTGHTSSVGLIAFSPDGSRLAAFSHRTIWLWDGMTGDHLAALTGHTGWVKFIAFSSGGSRLASASGDHTIRLWDGITGDHLATLTGHTNSVKSIAFSPDGSRLASSASYDPIWLWDGITGDHLATLTDHTPSFRSIAFSPDGSRLASASGDGSTWLWDGITGDHLATIRGSISPLNTFALSSDGLRLATHSDSKIWLWDGKTGKSIAELKGSGMSFSPDGSIVAAIAGNTILLYDGINGNSLATLQGHSKVSSLKFSPDGSIVAAIAGTTILLYDGINGNSLATLQGHSKISRMEFSPNGLRLISKTQESSNGWLWNPHIISEKSAQVLFLKVSPDGSKLALVLPDKTITVKCTNTNLIISSLQGHSGTIKAVIFSSDASKLASASGDKTVQLWHIETGTSAFIFTGHTGSVNDVVFSEDDSKLASASDDKTICLWDTKTGSHLKTISCDTGKVKTVLFHPDGSTLVSTHTNGRFINLWDSSTGTSIATLKSQLPNVVKQVILLSAGLHFASAIGLSNRSIEIWNPPYNSIKVSKSFDQFKSIIDFAVKPMQTPVENQVNCSNCNGDQSQACGAKAQTLQGIMAVQQKVPSIFGLVAFCFREDNTCEMAPFCWFPSGFIITACSFVHDCSTVAVLCNGHRVLLLDITKVSLPF